MKIVMIRGMDEDMVKWDVFIAVFALVSILAAFVGFFSGSFEAIIATEICVIGPLLVAKDYK